MQFRESKVLEHQEFANVMNQTLHEMNISMAEEQGDLLIQNVKIVDVFSETVFSGSLLIANGKIIAINPSRNAMVKEIFDGEGLYAVPGFIDPHIHIESTLVTPKSLASAIVPAGTTTIIAETLDLASQSKENGVNDVKALLKDLDQLPYRLLPVSPAKKCFSKVANELLRWEKVSYLGEMHNKNIIARNKQELNLVVAAKLMGKIVTAHIGEVTHQQLNLFPLVGLTDDHDLWTYEDLITKMQYGIMPMIREGQLHNMEKLISAIVKNGIPTDKMMFCTDDITANYIMENGHMDYIVRKAIGLGINPIKAIKMVTINTAEHFNLEGQFGSLTPGKAADIVLLPKLHEVKPAYVFTNGKLVAKNGILLEKIKNDYSELKKIFKPGLQNLKLEQIAISVKDQQLYTENKKVKIKVYNITNKSVEENWLNVRNGKIMNDLSKDILKMVVIDRYSEDKKHTKWAFVTGFKLKKGAIAIQVTLEEKRVAVVGTSDAEILHAVMEIDKYQGADVVVCENKVIGVLPLPIAGMMSDLSAEEVTTEMSAIYEELAKLGCNIEEPFFQVKEMFYMGYNAFQ